MRLQGLFLNNWVLKLLSLGFAVFLWFFVVGEEKAEVTITMPTEIVNLPKNLVVANDIPDMIYVRVLGPRSVIRDMVLQRLPKIIDLKNATAGKIAVHIDSDTLPIPSGVKVTRYQPSEFDIMLEPVVRKEVPVRPEITGTVANGYKIKKIETTPDRVTVSGTAKELNKIKELRTLPINIDGATEIVKVRSGLNMQNINNNNVSANNNDVTVTIDIKSIKTIKRFQKIPVQIYPLNERISFWPKKVSVTVKGPLKEINDMSDADINIIVETQNLAKGVYMLTPKTVVPEGISVMRVIPQKIKVYKTKK